MTANIAGLYHSTATGIAKNDFQLVIGSRNAPTPHKPKHYLLQKLPAGKYKYISSLYPAQEGTKEAEIYTFDYQGTYYRLQVNTTAGIAKIEETQKEQR